MIADWPDQSREAAQLVSMRGVADSLSGRRVPQRHAPKSPGRIGLPEPEHRRGIVGSEPRLYFLGRNVLHSVSSEQIHGVGRDAAHIADDTAARCSKGGAAGTAANRLASLDR